MLHYSVIIVYFVMSSGNKTTAIMGTLLILFALAILVYNLLPSMDNNNSEKLDKKISKINLDDPVTIKFVKGNYSEYIVYWYNPYISEWLTIPSYNAYIHNYFTLTNSWGFNYQTDCHTCSFKDIEYVKSQYKTIRDIKRVLDIFQGKRSDYLKWKEAQEELPNVVL